ncbi:MAG TPA: TonB-dependent receptor [Candidatus Angelobacter sp.]
MNTKLRYLAVLVAASLALVFCIPSFGQVLKGSCSGLVTDPQGAVVTGAQVKAKNMETGVVFPTTTDSSGNFRLNLLPVGKYTVEISAKGFKTVVQNGVDINAGLDRGLGTVKMTLGEQSTTVEVSAEAPLVETTQSQISSTFSGTALNTFAGIQENEGMDRLALFVPGVAATRSDNFSNTNGGGFSSNGLRGRNNDQEIDGQNNNDNSVGGPGLFVSDTNFVQQYVIITNNFGPEYGRNAGSVVNIITKSGGNAWHGSVFGTEFSNFLNAMSNTQKHANKVGTGSGLPGTATCTATNPQCNPLTGPPRSNEEFSGGTLGGPIVKNKWFVFGGFDTDIFSGSSTFIVNTTTPTPAGLATLGGCFPTGIQAQQVAALAKFGPYGQAAGNPAPTAISLINFTAAQTGTACNGVQVAGVQRTLSTPVRAYNFPIRVDGQIGSDNVMARYLYNKQTTFNSADNSGAGYFINIPALSQMILLGDTHNFSSHMVNEARVGFGRLGVSFGGNSLGNPFEPPATQVLNALANVSISGSIGYGPATNLPQSRMVNTWQAQDNWNLVRGKHSLKGGINWSYQRSPNTFLPNVNGQFAYDNLAGYINGVIDLNPTPSLRRPGLNSVTIAAGNPVLDFREYDTFLYGGDDWKIKQNLTLNLGLTWTYYGNPAQLFTDITTKRESNPATALWLQTLPVSARIVPQNDAPKNSFGPAVGFAYVPQWGGMFTGHGKTTIRGGFRMLYDPPFYNIFLNTSTSAPFGFLQTLSRTSTPSLPASIALPAAPVGPAVRSALGAFIASNTFDPRTQSETVLGTPTQALGPDKVYTWSFGFEREVSRNAALEVRYVGNMGRNLYQTVDGNPFAGTAASHGLLQDFPNLVPNASGITPCAATTQVGPGAGSDVGRVSCGLGVVRARTNGSFSDYQGVQTEFRANNLFKQLTIRAGYTFSKNLDNVSEIFATGTAGNTLFASQNPFQTGDAERSISGLNIPTIATVAFTESLPFFREQHGLIGHILGGWNFSGAYIWASGQPFTPRQGGVFTNVNSKVAATGNYFDTNFATAFVGDPARPFFGNRAADPGSVGIFCGDLVSLLGAASVPCASIGGNAQLLSFNALNAPQGTDPRGFLRGGATTVLNLVPITTNDARYIINMHTAQSVFGTPFGSVPRNTEVDAPSNRLDAAIFKMIKLGERSNFEMRLSALNALNHFNYGSIDPNMEDAGLGTAASLFGLGFNNPSQTAAGGRVVAISGRLTF